MAEHRSFSELQGECALTHTQTKKDATYSTKSRANSFQSLHMILLHTGSEEEKGERTERLKSSPPEELERWMDGRTEREMKVG